MARIITLVLICQVTRLVAMTTKPTSERILDSAMSLFAGRGYEATSVGSIEMAAGLAPRSGALYQHFKGKQDVLEQALDRQLAVLDNLGSSLADLPLGDFRAELTLMARWNLESLDKRRELAMFLRRDGDRLPDKLQDKLYRRLVEEPYAQVVEWLRQRFDIDGSPEQDLEALALILIEPMASYRSLHWVFGKTPGGVDDDRFVETWVELCLAYARRIDSDI
jgi:AcrR family transcriptional regulator